MKTLHVSVANKIAAYNKADGVIVCGNSDYQIEFNFDAEWNAHEKKKARFVSNGKYEDVEFTGNICPVPVMYKTGAVEVGVYIDGENMSTTTGATITCTPSIKCATDKAKPEYIATPAEMILAAADEVTGVKGQVIKNTWDIRNMKEQLGVVVPEFGVIEEENEVVTVPYGAQRYAKIMELHGAHAQQGLSDLAGYYVMWYNYPNRIMTDKGKVLFEMPSDAQSRLPEIGLAGGRSYIDGNWTPRDGNYIFFEDGKAYYKQTVKAVDYMSWESGEYVPAEGEERYDNVSDHVVLVRLATPIVTDVTEYLGFDGVIDIGDAKSITVEMKHTEQAIKDESPDETNDVWNGWGSDPYYWSVGKTKFAFEL